MIKFLLAPKPKQRNVLEDKFTVGEIFLIDVRYYAIIISSGAKRKK